MRPNQQNKNRSRGRNNNNGRKNVNPLSRNFESNGPDVKIRGNAAHIAERYVQLARDAQSMGDSVMAENYFQHAEHYFRILSAAQVQIQPRSDQNFDYDDDENDGEESGSADNEGPVQHETAPSEEREQPEPEAVETEAAKDTEETRERTRSRRPRRRRPAQTEERGDLSGAPQPDVGELPAFLTGGPTNAAE